MREPGELLLVCTDPTCASAAAHRAAVKVRRQLQCGRGTAGRIRGPSGERDWIYTIHFSVFLPDKLYVLSLN